MKRLVLFLCLWASLAVQGDVFTNDLVIEDPTPDLFSVCHDTGCRSVTYLSLSAAQWGELKNLFIPPPGNAEDERRRIRIAIGRMETFVGAMTDTWRDKGRNNMDDFGQMDCIDESTNTTLYLTLFAKYGFLRFHQVEDRETRGWFLFGWPHTTAVIREKSSGVLWVVDSWFLDNGQPPFILPLETWKDGWSPESDTQGYTRPVNPGR